MSEKLSALQRLCLADAYAEQGRLGLSKDDSGGTWRCRAHSARHSNRTVQSLVARNLLSLWVKGTVAHVTDRGAVLHEELCEREKAEAA